MSCIKRDVQLHSGHGITRNPTHCDDTVFWRRASGLPNDHQIASVEALSPRGRRGDGVQMRLWTDCRARPANASQKRLSVLRNGLWLKDRDGAARLLRAPSAQAVGSHAGPLLQSPEQVLSELRPARHSGLRTVAARRWCLDGLRVLCSGHGRPQRAHGGTARYGWRLRTRKLPLGEPHNPSPKSARRSHDRLERRSANLARMGGADGIFLLHAASALQGGLVSGAGFNGANPPTLNSRTAR
jgi:hypothetical protein